MERSIFSTQSCFIKLLKKNTNIHPAQFEILDEWFNFSITHTPVNIDLAIYLKTNPEIAYHKIKQRARIEEANIELSSLKSLHDLHEN